jgi:ABC-type multidrug transport system fused ATPase/permease subunit
VAAWRLVARSLRLVSALGITGRLSFVAVALLHALERLALVSGALCVARGSRTSVLIAAAALGIVVTARGATRLSLARQARVAIADGVVAQTLGGDVMVTRSDEETLVAVLEGLYHGEQLLGGRLPALLGDMAAAPVVAIALWIEEPPAVVLVVLLATLAAAAAVAAAGRVMRSVVEAADSAYTAVYEDVATAIGGRLELVASGRVSRFRSRLRHRLARWQRVASRADTLTAVGGRAPAAAAAFVVGVAIALHPQLRDGSSQTLVASVVLGGAALPTFLGLTKGLLDTLRTVARLRPLFELLDGQPGPMGARAGTPLPRFPATVEWNAVSYAYPSSGSDKQRWALRDVRVTWKMGQVLMLSGANGSGKSTMLRLLLGLGRAASGSISVGGVDLFDLDLEAWRGSIAYLPQRPYLPGGATVRDAVSILVDGADEERMRRELLRVGLWDVLAARPEGDPFAVRVGTLSAGERQRLALARLLCRDAPVVLLDEPDANLDAGGLALVEQLVRELSRDRMVAIAAHSPELLSLGDLQIALEEGSSRIR